MGKLKMGCVGIAAIFVGLMFIGAQIPHERPYSSSPLEDAKAAIRLKLENSEVRELHYFEAAGVVCGQVKHDKSDVGFAPFAYSHKLGLSVAKVWGRNEPEELNKQYGCSFLPIAYSDEWKSPFWGGPRGDIYEPTPEVLSARLRGTS